MSDAPESPSDEPGIPASDPVSPPAPGASTRAKPAADVDAAIAEYAGSPVPPPGAPAPLTPEPPKVEPVVVAVTPADEPLAPVFTFTFGHLLWVVIGLAFAGLRLGPLWQAPVGGTELAQLAGAWQASIGLEDSRYVPTFFQFVSSFFFRVSDSEVPIRVLSYIATLTVPFALYRARRIVGEPVALLALFLLAIDAATISFSSNGSAMGFDLAIAAWVFVLAAERKALAPGLLGIVAFLCATSGPIVLPLLLGVIVVAIFKRERPEPPALIEIACGVAVAIVVTSFAYGTGPVTLRLAPLDLFAKTFTEEWSTMTTFQVLLVYGLPLVLGAMATAAYYAHRISKGAPLEYWETLLLAWSGVALAAAVASIPANSTAGAAALTLPAAILVAAGLARAIPAMFAAEWGLARFVLPASVGVALIALNFVIDWARLNEIGNAGTQAVVVITLFAAGIGLLFVGLDRRTRPALLSVAIAVGILPTLSGAFGIGLSGIDEPIPSPRSTVQARQIRDIALEAVARDGGVISIHPALEQAATWPFRDSGNIEIASNPSANASIVIWPATSVAPEGYVPLAGTWAFEASVTPPTRNFLRYLRWLTDRNTLVIIPEALSVYLKASGEGE